MLVLSVDPVLQEVRWRGEAERGMQPLAVVERFDVIEDVRLGFGLRAVARAMHALIHQAVRAFLICRASLVSVKG